MSQSKVRTIQDVPLPRNPPKFRGPGQTTEQNALTPQPDPQQTIDAGAVTGYIAVGGSIKKGVTGIDVTSGMAIIDGKTGFIKAARISKACTGIKGGPTTSGNIRGETGAIDAAEDATECVTGISVHQQQDETPGS